MLFKLIFDPHCLLDLVLMQFDIFRHFIFLFRYDCYCCQPPRSYSKQTAVATYILLKHNRHHFLFFGNDTLLAKQILKPSLTKSPVELLFASMFNVINSYGMI